MASTAIQKFELIVDPEDQWIVERWNWFISGKGYPACWINGANVLLHKLIAPHIIYCDHKNGNKFDARKENLRLATRSQNKANSVKQSNNTSGYKGVTFRKDRNIWIAIIRVQGTLQYLGCSKFPEVCAQLYNRAALFYFGEFAKLNEVLDETF